MQKYRCYGKDDFGNPYDAMSIKDDYGEWCKADEVDARIAELAQDAAIGRVVWLFIDRMNDVAPPGDSAERILAEFTAAVMPAIDAALSRKL